MTAQSRPVGTDNAAYLQDLRAREDIRGYHTCVDNVLVNSPDPKSTYFAAEPLARHDKDFASYDRQ